MEENLEATGGLPGSARALLDAVVAIGSDLDLHNVLDRIVRSACELTGATYGALGVIGREGGLSDFLTYGIDAETRARIGDPPHGRGILGLLIRHPQPIRLSHLAEHPESFGFPADHPPMDSFLGVPVRVRGTVFGNLYLTEKRGGVDFTAQDETLVQALASAAGFVIDNARAYSLSERQRAWLEASARLTEVLQAPVGLDDALQHVAVATRVVSRAAAVGIVSCVGEQDPALLAADGRAAAGLTAALDQLVDEIKLVAGGAHAPARRLASPQGAARGEAMTASVLPLRASLAGDLVLVVLDGRPVGVLDVSPSTEQELVASFADQAGLALDRVRALADREELAVVTDRDRIARDLHDVVIQRLFATGLQLQSIGMRVADPEVRGRLETAVADLDATIRDIRGTIFELHHRDGPSLRADVQALVREYADVLAFAPRLTVEGPLDTAVPGEVAEQLVAVLREALSNVARHARARTVDVRVRVSGAEVSLEVVDDGVGLSEERRESGLRNLRGRAESRGGAMRLAGVEPHGTALEWRVPLSPRPPGP